jgi:surface antigen
MSRATKLKGKVTKKLFKRHSLLLANVALILAVTATIGIGQHNASNTAKTNNLFNQVATSQAAAPLDTVSSADIAVNIAQAVNIPEVIPVVNQADSAKAQISQASATEAIADKPQLVAAGSKSRQDITKYPAQPGESLAAIAEKFGVSVDTIKWSNNIVADTVSTATPITVPPRNGIVYQVKAGDTADTLASKYSASKDQIVAFNDIELTGTLPVGENILIPDGKKPNDPAPAVTTVTRGGANNSSATSAATYAFVANYGGNGYASGYCTWYVASRISVPNNWGNANTWASRARSSGWNVSSVPVSGAIFQTGAGYYGHVGIVEEVFADGTMSISDMNGIAGFARVGYGRVPVGQYPNYIYR